MFAVDHYRLINLLQQLTDSWHFSWIELLNLRWIHGHTNPARLWVDTKWSLEQVISMFRDLCVDSRPGVLEDDIFHRSQEESLRERR